VEQSEGERGGNGGGQASEQKQDDEDESGRSLELAEPGRREEESEVRETHGHQTVSTNQ